MALDKVFVAAMSVSFAGTVLLCIALSTPYWLANQEDFRVSQKFVHGGLWSMCFKQWDPEYDIHSKVYDGCYYIFEKELEFISTWIRPGWFTGVQVIVSLSTFVLLFASLMQFLHFMRLIGYPLAVRVTSAFVSLAIAIILTVAVILYGVRSSDSLWMPDPERNFLSWSFIFAVITAFFDILAAMLFVVTSLKVRYERRYAEGGDYRMNNTSSKY